MRMLRIQRMSKRVRIIVVVLGLMLAAIAATGVVITEWRRPYGTVVELQQRNQLPNAFDDVGAGAFVVDQNARAIYIINNEHDSKSVRVVRYAMAGDTALLSATIQFDVPYDEGKPIHVLENGVAMNDHIIALQGRYSEATTYKFIWVIDLRVPSSRSLFRFPGFQF